jgi:integrase
VNSYDVRIYSIDARKERPKPYRVRWRVGRRSHSKSFLTRGLADSHRSALMRAARQGEPFDVDSGLPASLREPGAAVTWYAHACQYAELKWPAAAGKTRISTADALATVTAALVRDAPGRPTPQELRVALAGWAFNAKRRDLDRPTKVAAVLAWVERHSLPLSTFDDPQERPELTRRALAACFTKLDGTPAAATTGRRKRAVFYNALGHAVERGHLTANPVDAVQWKTPKVADEVDRRVVASPAQVRQLLIAVSYIGRAVGPRLVAFFALLYFAALRPSEALQLRRQDCDLPETGWGRVLVESTRPEVGRAWTDDGARTEHRGLKWRGRREVRSVPIPPELVAILRAHLDRYGAGSDGRLFRTALGGHYARSAYDKAWQKARERGLPPELVASPLAGRPYDLRHGGVTLWLNSGMPAPEVARRAGHSVDVLLKIYAGCIDGQTEAANGGVDRLLE